MATQKQPSEADWTLVRECDGWSEAEYALAILRLEDPSGTFTVRGTGLGWAVYASSQSGPSGEAT